MSVDNIENVPFEARNNHERSDLARMACFTYVAGRHDRTEASKHATHPSILCKVPYIAKKSAI